MYCLYNLIELLKRRKLAIIYGILSMNFQWTSYKEHLFHCPLTTLQYNIWVTMSCLFKNRINKKTRNSWLYQLTMKQLHAAWTVVPFALCLWYPVNKFPEQKWAYHFLFSTGARRWDVWQVARVFHSYGAHRAGVLRSHTRVLH